MKYVGRVLRWLLVFVFALLALSMALSRDWSALVVVVAAGVLCLPVIDGWVDRRVPRLLGRVGRVLLVLFLVLAVVRLWDPTRNPSIYHSPEVKAALYRIYDEKMTEWPVPYEDLFFETEYGRIHVVASGADDAPPLLLLHASGVASWSWKYNVEALSRRFRVYAVDLIGDAGKSEYRSLRHVLRSGADQARLYAAIADSLGASSAFVAGASEGGFIATNYALHYPERVRKLALIGPMGYSGALGAILRITLAQMFPLAHVQERTFAWAFSRNAAVQAEFSEWFHFVMSDLSPIKVPPLPFSADERRRLRVPVLFIFGNRDNLVGDPGRAGQRVQDIADVEVRVLDTGHLVAAEEPQRTTALLTDFFGDEKEPPS